MSTPGPCACLQPATSPEHMNAPTLTVQHFFDSIAQGQRFRIIDLRGDYYRTIPGAIPVQFDPDIFFEDEAWTQDMLGVVFREGQPVLLVCDVGNKSDHAVGLFREKNPRSRFQVLSLQGGMLAYQAHLEKITTGFKRQSAFIEELTDLGTSPERMQHVVRGLLTHRQPTGLARWLPFLR